MCSQHTGLSMEFFGSMFFLYQNFSRVFFKCMKIENIDCQVSSHNINQYLMTMVIIKRRCKDTDINVCHSTSLTGNDRHKKAVLRNLLRNINASYAEHIANYDVIGAEIVTGYIVVTLARYDVVATVDAAHPIRYFGDRYRFIHACNEVGMIAATYWFKDLRQLRLLKGGLQIPDKMQIPADRSVYGGEELL